MNCKIEVIREQRNLYLSYIRLDALSKNDKERDELKKISNRFEENISYLLNGGSIVFTTTDFKQIKVPENKSEKIKKRLMDLSSSFQDLKEFLATTWKKSKNSYNRLQYINKNRIVIQSHDAIISDYQKKYEDTFISVLTFQILISLVGFFIVCLVFNNYSKLVEAENKISIGLAKERKAEYMRIKQEQRLSALKRSNKDLEGFAHIASHDLKEPLRMITSYAELLSERYKDKIDSKADKYINYIIQGTTRMRVLIEDLLSYSCVKTHDYKFELLNVDELIESVKENLVLLINESNGEIKTKNLPEILGDRIQMIQLFQNLISNAIKYRSPDRKLVVEISASKDEENYIFSVKDNGMGIDSKYFNNIFVIFQRLHRQKEHPGSGIGLAIAKSIVDNHDGNIWVDSALNKGSTFHFTIPMKRELK